VGCDASPRQALDSVPIVQPGSSTNIPDLPPGGAAERNGEIQNTVHHLILDAVLVLNMRFTTKRGLGGKETSRRVIRCPFPIGKSIKTVGDAAFGAMGRQRFGGSYPVVRIFRFSFRRECSQLAKYSQ
jgi:hypothetical protein